MLFLMRFWPALLPIILYTIWWFLICRNARKTGTKLPRFSDGPLYSVVVASLLLGVACFVYMGITAEGVRENYVPPAAGER